MGLRQREWAKRAHRKLIEDLGGKCAVCGSTIDLELDHKSGITWAHSALEWSHRISVYRSEAKQGLLRVLCRKHNRPGRPRSEIPF